MPSEEKHGQNEARQNYEEKKLTGPQKCVPVPIVSNLHPSEHTTY